MKPIRLEIRTKASDHFIYNGRLYVALASGGIKVVRLSDLFECLRNKYKDYSEISSVLDISFRRNLHWRSNPVVSITSIPEVHEGLMNAWKRISEEYFLQINLEDIKGEIILKEVPSELLDINIYGNKILLGCLDGLYINDIENPLNKRNMKKFDGKTYRLTTGYSTVILSLGKDGLSYFDPFVNNKVRDKDHMDNKSLLTSWTPAGGLMNYPDFKAPCFIGNEIKRNKTKAEDQYFIRKFGVVSEELKNIIKTNTNDYIFTFNGKNRQYVVDRENKISFGKLNVRDQRLQSFSLEDTYDNLHLKPYGQPISGNEVADCPVIEFDEKVCLIQHENVYDLEKEAALSVHTYPKSSHFRDIVSITTDNFISLHSLDVLSYPDISLHPEPRRHIKEIPIYKGLEELMSNDYNKINIESDFPF